MLVCYRDDGFWLQLWWIFSRRLIGGHRRSLPGPGFVGRVSSSFLATEQQRYRLVSTRIRRTHSIYDAHLWRLTCVWETSRLPSWAIPFGIGWGLAGCLWAVAGAVASAAATRTTSI